MVSTFPGIQTLEKSSHKESASEGKCPNAQAQPLFLNFSSPRFGTHNSFPAPLTPLPTLWPFVISAESTWTHLYRGTSAHLLPLTQGWDTALPLQPLKLPTCSLLDSASSFPLWRKGFSIPTPNVGFFSSPTLTQPRIPWSFSLNSACDSFNPHGFPEG